MKIFKEEQRFTQWWIWLLFLGLNLFFFYGIYQQLILETPFGNKPTSNNFLIITSSLFLLVTVFFFYLKLKTRIDETGIYYRFSPIQSKFKKIKWETIKTVRVIKYKPIIDYGGWGIKLNSYSVKGNIGILFEFKNGKKFLIGSQKKNEATRVLETYKNKIS